MELDWDSPLGECNENDYSERLAHDERWLMISNAVKKRDGCCIMCKSKNNLRAHHVSYEDFYNPKFLVTLCDRCHEQVHEFTKVFKEEFFHGRIRKSIFSVQEEIARVIDSFVIERCYELNNKNGDLRFFTGPLDQRVSINKWVRNLVTLDPYGFTKVDYAGNSLNATDFTDMNVIRTTVPIEMCRGVHTRYNDMRLVKMGRKEKEDITMAKWNKGEPKWPGTYLICYKCVGVTCYNVGHWVNGQWLNSQSEPIARDIVAWCEFDQYRGKGEILP